MRGKRTCHISTSTITSYIQHVHTHTESTTPTHSHPQQTSHSPIFQAFLRTGKLPREQKTWCYKRNRGGGGGSMCKSSSPSSSSILICGEQVVTPLTRVCDTFEGFLRGRKGFLGGGKGNGNQSYSTTYGVSLLSFLETLTRSLSFSLPLLVSSTPFIILFHLTCSHFMAMFEDHVISARPFTIQFDGLSPAALNNTLSLGITHSSQRHKRETKQGVCYLLISLPFAPLSSLSSLILSTFFLSTTHPSTPVSLPSSLLPLMH